MKLLGERAEMIRCSGCGGEFSQWRETRTSHTIYKFVAAGISQVVRVDSEAKKISCPKCHSPWSLSSEEIFRSLFRKSLSG